jgi:hypothetical protein
MTLLANAKADASQKDGTRFCSHNDDIFKEVLALKNGSELKEYAAGRATGEPVAFQTCEAGLERSTRSPVTTHRKKK